MAEYWKSLPRKFCEICKCWFADNKASIDFHERGKRHQENAQKQIKDIKKRSIKEFKKQQEYENDMEKIERAAEAAYKKDLLNMQGGDKSLADTPTTNKPFNSTPDMNLKPKKSAKNPQKKEKVTVKTEEIPPVSEESKTTKLWYETATEEGYKYYWNAETSESRWEPPEEGFISIEEQNEINSEAVIEKKQEKSSENNVSDVKEETPDSGEDMPSSFGPQPRYDPYGQWTTVEKKEPVQYDLQLPKPPEDVVEVFIPVYKDVPSLNFKEKVIGQLSDADSSNVTFKKRKFTGSLKRNARQRTTDDD